MAFVEEGVLPQEYITEVVVVESLCVVWMTPLLRISSSWTTIISQNIAMQCNLRFEWHNELKTNRKDIGKIALKLRFFCVKIA